jgi:hypothetical protein
VEVPKTRAILVVSPLSLMNDVNCNILMVTTRVEQSSQYFFDLLIYFKKQAILTLRKELAASQVLPNLIACRQQA